MIRLLGDVALGWMTSRYSTKTGQSLPSPNGGLFGHHGTKGTVFSKIDSKANSLESEA